MDGKEEQSFEEASATEASPWKQQGHRWVGLQIQTWFCLLCSFRATHVAEKCSCLRKLGEGKPCRI